MLYSSRLLPEWLRLRMLRTSLEPKHGAPSEDVSGVGIGAEMDFDDVPIGTAGEHPRATVGDVVKWQLRSNLGLVSAYLSTVQGSLVFKRHDFLWTALAEELSLRRTSDKLPGLPAGRICLILVEWDVIVPTDEFIQDCEWLLCDDNVNLHIVKGGHEIGIMHGKEMALLSMKSWNSERQIDQT